ncbi:hypothetical protein EDC01DRAFT_629267 [Geopyxis carbonaria]|nr:hypothetical protein EDC01DRAFT_629267 [Geopyxis carbonaria]
MARMSLRTRHTNTAKKPVSDPGASAVSRSSGTKKTTDGEVVARRRKSAKARAVAITNRKRASNNGKLDITANTANTAATAEGKDKEKKDRPAPKERARAAATLTPASQRPRREPKMPDRYGWNAAGAV